MSRARATRARRGAVSFTLLVFTSRVLGPGSWQLGPGSTAAGPHMSWALERGASLMPVPLSRVESRCAAQP